MVYFRVFSSVVFFVVFFQGSKSGSSYFGINVNAPNKLLNNLVTSTANKYKDIQYDLLSGHSAFNL